MRKANAHFQRRCGIGRCNGSKADANEEHGDHAFTTPAVRQPAHGKGEQAESNEARRRIWNEFGIAHPPLPGENQRCHRGEYQREQVIEKMTDVQEEEVEAVFH